MEGTPARPALHLPDHPVVNDVTRTLTFHRAFLPAWERHPDMVGPQCGGTSHTWGEHRERVLRLADGLGTRLGLTRTSRYAVLALNSIEYLELYHAAYLGAGIINPINIRLAPKEIAFILQDSGTEVLFVDAIFAPVAEAIRDNLPDLRSVVLIGAPPEQETRIDDRFDDVLAVGEAVVPPETEETDPCCLMYTGGTTGLPKGVVHTQRSHRMAGHVFNGTSMTMFADANYMIAAPMFHAATQPGVSISPTIPSRVMIIPMFTPAGFIEAVEAGGTETLIVPTMIRMVLDDPSYTPERMANLQRMTYGGSPMPAGVLKRMLDEWPDCEIVQGFGMTEGLPFSLLSDADHRAGGDRLRSAGRVIPNVDVSIQDPDGNQLAQGEIGEICTRAGHQLHGYWNRPEQNEESFSRGWFRTGDMGYLDEEHYLFLVDRAKDMIISGGENVYTAEVESAISTHPDVVDVAVIGIPSEEWGEAVHAVVVATEGSALTADAVIAHARESIAGYKVPRSVEVRTEPLPLSGAGKTLKRALRDPFWEGHDRGVS